MTDPYLNSPQLPIRLLSALIWFSYRARSPRDKTPETPHQCLHYYGWCRQFPRDRRTPVQSCE